MEFDLSRRKFLHAGPGSACAGLVAFIIRMPLAQAPAGVVYRTLGKTGR